MPKKPTEKDKFPHSGFPYRLEYMDGKDKRICWFAQESHLTKHIERYGIKNGKVEAAKGFSLTPPKPKRVRKPKKQPSGSKASQASKTKKSSKPAAKGVTPKAPTRKPRKTKTNNNGNK